MFYKIYKNIFLLEGEFLDLSCFNNRSGLK